MAIDKLHLLLTHSDDGTPVLGDGLSGDAAAEQDPEKKLAAEKKKKDEQAQHHWEEGDDPNDLEDQRWGVFAPEGPAGDRLLALIRPLIAARQEQQGGHDVRIF